MSRDHKRELTRRALIKWSVAAGAALGVSQTRLLEILERHAGRGVAQAAATTPTKRSVHIRGVNGGIAWFTLLWPHNAVAAVAGGSTSTWPFAAAQTQKIQGTGGALTLGPNTPFANLPANQQMTAFMAGSNEAHTPNPNSIVRSVNGNSLFAIVSVLQQASPTVIPVITVDDAQLGTAPGSPRPAVVPTGEDIVGLFNSAASRAGGLLEAARYAGHADLYRAHYETLAALNKAANRSTTHDAYATARSAAQFLGKNLAAELAITPTDLAAYGIDGNMRPDVAEIGKTLIVTAKAFQLRLTSSVVLPGLRDDPHDAFTNPTRLNATTAGLKRVLDAFMADLGNRTDTVTGTKLSDDIVMTFEGDTPKAPLDNTNWLDNTPQNSNWVYVFGGGKLKTGWFGGIAPGGQDGIVTGFDPTTGAATAYDGDTQAKAAVGAVAYAVTRGDIRAVQDFTRIDISGLIV
ncbi:MAG TPA: hypothetical protein VFV99_09235 [Kofleriaceae bacterium]|nr:hypothetical protein [Kofleriaceae bacterium]